MSKMSIEYGSLLAIKTQQQQKIGSRILIQGVLRL